MGVRSYRSRWLDPVEARSGSSAGWFAVRLRGDGFVVLSWSGSCEVPTFTEAPRVSAPNTARIPGPDRRALTLSWLFRAHPASPADNGGSGGGPERVPSRNATS